MIKPELLAPAGNLEKLKTAINFGADAVYLGGSKLNLRASADNFTIEELKEGLEYAHLRGKKVHVTLNVIPHNDDLNGIEDYITELYEVGVDAVLIADPGIMSIVHEVAPKLEIHLSTQASNLNYKSAEFWHKIGIKRIVAAREMSLNDLITLRKELPESCDIEAFVHGAMCMGYSGKCLLSNYITGRDSNRGTCTQPCRFKYHLYEEKEPGNYEKIDEDGNGMYFMNSKDLCMIEHIPELIEAGINSFKIEGRIKSSYYVASVVKAYRQAIDKYFEDPKNYKYDPKWLKELEKPSHRPYTTGFYFDEEIRQNYETSAYIHNYDMIGVVRDYNKETHIATIQQRNKVFNGDLVEVLAIKGDNKIIKLEDMRKENGVEIETANRPQMIFTVKCSEELQVNDILVKSKN
ncbi:peptidase U32 family protein [Clostridium saccharoperbutylacetonicum]|uniref:Peptidase U32 n=1 Tax=Clostridium saccharoperbutylacetonicum N1-4(HMT) TaxID=931276 RepID=M1MS78_9CLOT|nr:U32 family peptidase [Clostridium saccharoperbutylacetonicum]AGF57591.1 peptidase U32 [Clostridium saccharoperbutylacetonicum N1-4(HMT)]AQR96284.1 putative protease YdcP precursor [Clostridium saccharoperbutylacetonicum]NRT61641.1 putative protease [Clostridium saccharoperbutylacetonicum]NSB24964.1 putative protease [Clostridium saccharoperbutylacetonicum]NSB32157.1 putative protease [Clostridium saccharoperbutylacetonicum]